MKCFTFYGGSISPAIALQDDANLGKIVFLGEEGRGRYYEKIGLFRKDPPDITTGLWEAHPVKITVRRGEKNEKSFYVLAKPRGDSDQRILVRVNTCTGYIRSASGTWAKVRGNPERLVHASGAYGDAGRIGGWADDLVVMSPGDVIWVRGSRDGLWIIDYSDASNGPVALVEHDWHAKQAIEKGEDIQWL